MGVIYQTANRPHRYNFLNTSFEGMESSGLKRLTVPVCIHKNQFYSGVDAGLESWKVCLVV